jgi:gliding motility-associated-like protein
VRQHTATHIRRNFSVILVITGLLSFYPFSVLHSQDCPPNIDFERGNFSGWTCYVGSVSAGSNSNFIYLQPVAGPAPNQHVMYSAATYTGFSDPYGGFPVLCPNGSNYSVRLGNAEGGAQAEGLSYQFTIPPGRNTYALIYHYAVVFQDPNHLPFQQPRLELEIKNITDDQVIGCSSFTFFPNGSPLPGFFVSPLSDSTPVWCKDWTAVTINLNNQAGKTIRLFFKTADCTFRKHFGYAYIDVNSECSSEFTGATYCHDDTAVSLTAPYGYQSYNWYDNAFTTNLGTQQVLHLSPPPPTGSTYAVEIVPYNGYGCLDTLYAKLVDTLTLKANAGPDALSCNNDPVLIGGVSKTGVVYAWSPAAGLSNTDISNPQANPLTTTPYILTVRSTGGGCMNTDTVIVTASSLDSTLTLVGKDSFCITAGDSAVLHVTPTNSIQWKKNGSALNGAIQPGYKVTQSGSYSALLTNNDGCTLTTRAQDIFVETPRRPLRYPLQYAIVNTPVELSARNFGSTILWSPGIYLDDPSIFNPNFNSPSVLDQLYTIKITTSLGCITVDTQLVKTIKEVKVYVPTGFTPNNDGRNDFLRPILMGIKEMKSFRVFNRWGQIVYDMRNGDERGWDGRIGDMQQQTGVFIWMFEGVGLDQKNYVLKGTTVLIR